MRKYYHAYQRLLSLTNLERKEYTESKAELERSLKRTRDFLSALGDPQNKLKIVHVTGTSGKGSVCTMMHAILRANGDTVGRYTSPHTTSFLERFALTNELLDPAHLTKYINDIIAAYQVFLQKNTPLSFFELSTCLALYAFAKEKVRWCVLEVGCGGRYDATNVIGTPSIAIITNVDKDHTEILGSSLSQIAFEKAGIIRKDGTVVCGETRPALRRIFQNEAVAQSAALFFVPPPPESLIDESRGAHQQHNAALAQAAARELGINEHTIGQGLAQTEFLPCRFETIQQKPRVILDGAHSPAKVAALAKQLKSVDAPLHIVFGCSTTKDAEKMLDLLKPLARSFTMTRFRSTFRKASNPAELLSLVPSSKREGVFLDAERALRHALSLAKHTGVVVVTGSLYLAGEVRTAWISEDQILAKRSSF